MQKARQQLRGNFASLVARAARQWRRTVDRRLQPFGLTEATLLPLIYLARAPVPMRQKDLAAALALDGSSVVRALHVGQRDVGDGAVERLHQRRQHGTDRYQHPVRRT
jgi:MarR family transcriptional regulator for hemolysin